jgi:hypothetical protein
VLGVPASAVRRLHWRSDFSSSPPRRIAHRLAPDGEPRPARLPIPAGTTSLSLPARVKGNALAVGLAVADERGRIKVLSLGEARGRSAVLSAQAPRSARYVLGLQFALPAAEQFAFAHRETEATVSTAPAGTLELGSLDAHGPDGRRLVTDWRGWVFPSGGRVVPGMPVRIRFAFQDTGRRLIFRPRQPTDGRPMPVVVSPEIAAAGGGVGREVTLDFQDASVTARIVGVASRMPTIASASGPFVLADGGWLSTAVGASGIVTWRSAASSQLCGRPLSSAPTATITGAVRSVSV